MEITPEINKDQQQLVIKHIGLQELFKKWLITLDEFKRKKLLVSNIII